MSPFGPAMGNGHLEPTVINDETMIISGHRRYYAMTQFGWAKRP
jgi:hypothetical protein